MQSYSAEVCSALHRHLDQRLFPSPSSLQRNERQSKLVSLLTTGSITTTASTSGTIAAVRTAAVVEQAGTKRNPTLVLGALLALSRTSFIGLLVVARLNHGPAHVQYWQHYRLALLPHVPAAALSKSRLRNSSTTE